MSKTIPIKLKFLEPYRLVDFGDNRNPSRLLRGESFVRWKKRKDEDGGWRPFITGTLLRSATIRAAEEILSLTGGKVGETPCCNGIFKPNGRDQDPKYLRKRPTLEWSDQEKPCEKDPLCPFCYLLGRFDKSEEDDKNIANYHIHFGNLELAGERSFDYRFIQEIASERILNRVDFKTGKAHDYFKMWEVEDERFLKYKGKVTISDYLVGSPAEKLLKDSLCFIDRLCGALCVIEEVQEKRTPIQPAPSPETDDSKIKGLAEDVAMEINTIFKGTNKMDKLRTLSDAIRRMRIEGHEVVLPKGKDEEGHFLWDKIKYEGKSVSSVLGDAISNEEIKSDWRKFCELLGQTLYEYFKKASGGIASRGRMLGDAEYYSEQGKAGPVIRIDGGKVKEWIFTGKLRAETPFYFGTEAEQSGKQTSLPILLDKKTGKYRIPRSVLRGALRRDLKSAFGTGCNVELGGDRPCDCPVCMVMRGITILDTKSDYCEPPEVRHRIRCNQFVGRVDEGALFDIEVGPEGIAFPFVMRYRGAKLEQELIDVIRLYEEGIAFLGGSGSTGKGRFCLEDLKVFEWDIGSSDALKSYIDNHGLRGNEQQIQPGPNYTGLSKVPDLPQKRADFNPWNKIVYEIHIQSPLLSNDPIGALFDGGSHDAIAYKKRVWKDGEIIKPEPFVFKGESIRGILRTALGRTHIHKQDNKERYLFELEHEDCTCALCTIFGNEHETGKIRFEDLRIGDGVDEKHLDHVAIDRFTGGAVDKKKFDDSSLAGSPGKPIKLEGCFWLRADISSDDKKRLINAFCDVRDGLYPLGSKGGIGYGWAKELQITFGPPDFKLPEPERISQDGISSLYSFPQLPPLQIEEDKLYSPYYFLKPTEKVDRDWRKKLTGHEKFQDDLLTGRIECTLNTLSPLIIPDTGNNDAFGLMSECEGHHNYKFFRLNDEVMIPGSEIRGMISSVYEALTNSCLRVFDEERYLSRRLTPKDDKGKEENVLQGIVHCEGADFFINEASIIRLPLYDDETTTEKISLTNNILSGSWENDEHKTKMEKAIAKNNLMAKCAQKNRTYLEKHRDALNGDIKVRFNIRNKENRNDYWAELDENGTECGYIKFTGLNMVNQEQVKLPNDNYPSEDIKSLKVLLNSWPPDEGWTEEQRCSFVDKLFRPAPTAPQSAFFHEDEFTDKSLISTLCSSIRNGYSISLGKNDDSIEWLNNLIRYPAFYDTVLENLSGKKFSRKIEELANRTRQSRKMPYNKLNRSEKTLVSKLNRLVIESLYTKAPKMRDRKPYKYPRPLLIVIKDNKRYTIPKRCERIFYKETSSKFHVPQKVADQYRDIIRDCRNNYGRIDERFLTILPGETLKSGDLVYFTQANGEIKAIMPVRISRITDSLPLGKRLCNDDLRPCEREILGDFDIRSLANFQEKKLFRLHPEGLCPSCRLFGTTHYKGRVRFGFAKHEGELKWLMGEGKYLTLPLLERPRPTWSMPNEDSVVPGRKFYVHHNGWKEIKESKIEIDKNNRTVEPLDEGNTFKFDLFFENLAPWELGLLIYSLELEKDLAHKLGMAKAFGFGSVKIDIDKILLRISPNEWKDRTGCKGYWLKKGFNTLGSWFDKNWEQVEPAMDIKEIKIPEVEHIIELRTLLQIPEVNAKVRYPALRAENDPEGLPGYVELGDEEDGRKYLTIPWHPWYPMLKTGTEEKTTGRVKWFDHQKGWGFITSCKNEDIFLHKSGIKDYQCDIDYKGKDVRFNITQGTKGPTAVNVEIVSGEREEHMK